MQVHGVALGTEDGCVLKHHLHHGAVLHHLHLGAPLCELELLWRVGVGEVEEEVWPVRKVWLVHVTDGVVVGVEDVNGRRHEADVVEARREAVPSGAFARLVSSAGRAC